MSKKESPTADLTSLLALVARLRAPDGCPWDRQQELVDVRSYLLEEAHETAAAIDEALVSGDFAELAAELGDLLFQAAFIGRLAEEGGGFTLGEAIAGVHAKMVARHPHVFGDESLATAAEVRQAWERRKLAENPERDSLLDGVPKSLPGLTAAYRMTQKAAGVGFDWPAVEPVFDKLREETAELEEALRSAPAGEGRQAAIRNEIGDLLFTLVNLARKLEVDPEAALAGTNLKFRRRFQHLEQALAAQGRNLTQATLAELEELWEEAKREES